VALPVLIAALEHEDYWVRLEAVAALGYLGEAARPALPQMRRAQAAEAPWPYVKWGLEAVIARLEK
jgi:HEAT repeat protein